MCVFECVGVFDDALCCVIVCSLVCSTLVRLSPACLVFFCAAFDHPWFYVFGCDCLSIFKKCLLCYLCAVLPICVCVTGSIFVVRFGLCCAPSYTCYVFVCSLSFLIVVVARVCVALIVLCLVVCLFVRLHTLTIFFGGVDLLCVALLCC